MLKRVSALLLALLMIVTLVGCGRQKRKIIELTLSTEDSEAILNAAGIWLPDPETAAGANSKVIWYSWFDTFNNYSESEVVNTGFFTFKERYGGTLEFSECTWEERFSRLAQLMLGGTPPDFFNGETENFPYYAIHGTFQPINDYIDFEDPLWKDIADYMRTYFSLGDDVYLLCTDLYFGSILAYNKRTIDEWGFEDPAELFYNNEWTWNEFYDMCVEFSNADDDRYALDGWFYSKSLQRSAGIPVVSLDTETGLFRSNMDDPRLERAGNLLYDLAKDECVYPWFKNNWKPRGGSSGASSTDFGDGLKEGKLLFSCGGPYHITGTVEEISAEYADVTKNELMFVPMPRDPEGDGKQYVESDPMGYCIVKDAPNPQGVALLAACDRFKAVDPTVMSVDRKQKVDKYLWTDEMLDMYDLCVDLANSGDVLISYDEKGLGSDVGATVETIERNGMQQDSSSWAQLKEAQSDKLSFYLTELNDKVKAFIETGELW